jgi:ACS family hexuronate transporter-like MFS transporter
VCEGVFHVGAIVTPLIVPWIALHLGWRLAFVLTGALGFVWPSLGYGSIESPNSTPIAPGAREPTFKAILLRGPGKIKWRQLLPHRQTWAFAAGKFMIDPIWWFYLCRNSIPPVSTLQTWRRLQCQDIFHRASFEWL